MGLLTNRWVDKTDPTTIPSCNENLFVIGTNIKRNSPKTIGLVPRSKYKK